MSKLLKNTILLSSIVASVAFANSQSDLEEYLTNQIENNPRVSEGSVKIVQKKPLEKIKGWDAYILDVNVKLKSNQREIHQKEIIFYNGRYVASDFVDTRTGKSIKDTIKPQLDPSLYTDANYVIGNKNAPHKIVVFSDPLCPFCKRFMPKVIQDVKKNPQKYALYHYNLALTRLHPASEYIVKAEIAARLQGKKIDLYKLYTEIQPIDPKEDNYIGYDQKDPKKILAVFNKIFHTNLTPKDLEKPAVIAEYEKERKIANDLLVAGTPTVYFDGVFDKSRAKYKKVK